MLANVLFPKLGSHLKALSLREAAYILKDLQSRELSTEADRYEMFEELCRFTHILLPFKLPLPFYLIKMSVQHLFTDLHVKYKG